MPKTNQNKTESIRKRLEEIKAASQAAARPAAEAEEIEMANVPPTESDVTPAAAKPAAAKAEVGAEKEEFALDGAKRFVWLLDGQQMPGYVRINDNTMTISDPVVGYTYSLPTSLPFVITVQGIGRLVSVEKDVLPKLPSSVKLRNGEFMASMAFPLSLPRVMWRVANRKIVWAVVQYAPTRAEWRVLRLKSTPFQTVYEAQQIMMKLLGESAYTKLKEAVELLAAPL